MDILDDFAVFILSHENPTGVKTLSRVLLRNNYPGKWYIILDDEDKCIDEYKRLHGEEHILLYNKDDMETKTDMMDAGGKRGITVYVRNACFELAKKIGVTYFMELDEDYNNFVYRVGEGNVLKNYPAYSVTEIIRSYLQFYIDNPSIVSLCLGQNGDLIGGIGNARYKARLIRKAMNSFICSVDRPFKFLGRMNDDVNAYCLWGSQGMLFLTAMDAVVDADGTQSHDSGMTEIYKDNGTYRKSFYSVMCCPSFIKIDCMGMRHRRVHHHIYWNNGVPKLISSKYKK